MLRLIFFFKFQSPSAKIYSCSLKGDEEKHLAGCLLHLHIIVYTYTHANIIVSTGDKWSN